MKKIWILLMLCLCWIPAIDAQDSVDDLIELLNAVPDTLEVRDSFITFVDYANLIESRPGTPALNKFADLEILPDQIQQVVQAALMGVNSGPNFMQYLYVGGAEWQELVGFDFLDIDRALAFGNPPIDVDILIGEFDTDAIADAFTAREYTSDEFGDMTIWCIDPECDEGMNFDFENRNPSNPFGGDLGRSEPLLVSERVIVSATDDQPFILVEDAIGDRYDSLADNPSFLSAVGTIDRDNLVIQGAFLNPAHALIDVADFFFGDDAPEDIEEAFAEILEEAGMLPAWDIVMLADTASDTEQVVYVTLVYRDLANAETAIEVVPARIDTMDSLMVQRPLMEVLAERGVEDVIANVISDEENDRYLAVFELRAPLATNEEADGGFGLVSSSMVYRLLIQMVYSRDVQWLATG